MKRLLLNIVFLLLLSACSSEEPSFELVSSKVNLIDGLERDLVYGDETGKQVTHTAIKYQFVLKNTGEITIGTKVEDKMTLKIIPNEKLKQISEEVVRENIFDEVYFQNGVFVGTETAKNIVTLKPNELGEYSVSYFLGANEKNDAYNLAPSKDKLEKLKKHALDGTLVLVYKEGTDKEKEIARFELNKEK
ncbi:hypothetical protein ACJ2A9_23110 [Anaerobacillus sp. MEB173]|uniref:hypothetical protein n=1 Tax=Anaerobacillus sp. MEB173 TaxID=3383345 RepID=UPI003F936BA4